jgi:hypothetical protein
MGKLPIHQSNSTHWPQTGGVPCPKSVWAFRNAWERARMGHDCMVFTQPFIKPTQKAHCLATASLVILMPASVALSVVDHTTYMHPISDLPHEIQFLGNGMLAFGL